MAKNKRGRHYRFTPRRQAALKKAQARSAANRRRRVGKAVGIAAATIAVGAVGGAVAHRRISSAHAVKLKTHKRVVTGNKIYARRERFIRSLPKPQLALPPGRGKRTVIPNLGPSMNPPMFQIRSTPQLIFKTNSKGVTVRTTRNRMKYDSQRRRAYWQAKPVGGAPRKKYTSTKRGRK